MEKTTITSVTIMGLSVRTSNAAGKADQDIPALWNRFMAAGILEKIPGKLDHWLYACYSDYDGDHTQPYTMYLGCKVAAGTPVPEGMHSVIIQQGDYQKFQAKGDLTKGAVVEAWHRIWQADLDRAYTTDFEAYDPQYSDPTQGVVDIYIALK
ncbi:GyrI-like domain-containing protein [Sediminicola luteus]|uniref:AraC effector-binding domain-containing protein n=1 Tax=Sediminicola luteus TaxID=319238 RepID=A0A2A4G4H8_9FLAO|nr:GyrI-like domain-containing protein [Sediminicola luteus]PCE62880.1 hypothetical protein B7P33_16515 [Sediminicola luteus]